MRDARARRRVGAAAGAAAVGPRPPLVPGGGVLVGDFAVGSGMGADFPAGIQELMNLRKAK